MPNYYSPNGNLEVWNDKPNGYYDLEEWEILHPNLVTLDELKAQKLQAIDQWTANKITGGFTSSASGEPVRYDSDKDTQLTMQGIALNVHTAQFAEKYPDGCPVRGYQIVEGVAIASEKTIFMLTAEQVLAWCADLSIHIGTCKQEGWTKQAAVRAAASAEELDAIELA